MILWDSRKPRWPQTPSKILNIDFSATLDFLRKMAGLHGFCARYGMPVNLFDGLDRIKIAAGPAVVSTPPTNAPPSPGGSGSTTNQQVVTSYYDSAGLAFTNANALGEKTIT